MKTKLLFLCAVLFLILGWNTKDGVLFFFFAVHLLTLAIGVVVSRIDRKRHPVTTIESLPELDTPTKADTGKPAGGGISTKPANRKTAQPA